MIERLQDRPRVRRAGDKDGKGEELPYRIELREAANDGAVERVLARAFNAALARAIFRAAQSEHPGRHILLCRGNRTIEDSTA